MRKKLIVVGAGGLGRIVYEVLRQDAIVTGQMDLVGFLDTRADLVLPEDIEVPVLGNPETFVVEPDHIFIPAVGVPGWRERLLAPLLAQGATFFSYSRAATLGARTTVGQGAFLTPGTVLSVDCKVGDFAYIDTYSVIGHDVHLGRSVTIGAMTFIAGGVRIGDGVAIHPRATISKGVQIGDGAVVGIGSVVVKNVPAHTTVFGNPARPIF